MMEALAFAVAFYTANPPGEAPKSLEPDDDNAAFFGDVTALQWARGMSLLAKLALVELGSAGVEVEEFLRKCGQLAVRHS